MFAQIQQIRRAYITNPHWGIALWFLKFDQALNQKDFRLCRFFLEEAQSPHYLFTEREQLYLASRQAALLLCEGIDYHKKERYSHAEKSYEVSRSIQHHLRHLEGEGQVIFAQRELQAADREVDLKLLDIIAMQPKVIGSGETALAERFDHATPEEQKLVVMAAKHCGYSLTLYKALAADDIQVQETAAAAFAWLEPGPDYKTLLDMMTSSSWFVRWQATRMVLHHWKGKKQEIYQERKKIHDTIINRLAEGEEALLVVRELVVLLSFIPQVEDTPALVKLLGDPDTDVLAETIKILERVGDRQAISALGSIANDARLEDNALRERVVKAIESIKKRHPEPKIRDIIFCRKLDAQERPIHAASKFFKSTPVIFCLVTISHPLPGCKVTCVLQNQEQVIQNDEQMTPTIEESASPDLPDPNVSRVLEITPVISEAKLIFPLSASGNSWLPATYTVTATLDGEAGHVSLFKIEDLVLPQVDAYQLVQLLGNGAFAQVYLGEHVTIQAESAVKIFSTTSLSAEDEKHFVLKMRTLSRLTHPHIIKIFGYGIESISSGHRSPYLVMEYIPKGTLRQIHPRNASVPITLIALYAQQIGSALQYMHDLGIMHGNLKPNNILLDTASRLLLSDFAIPGIGSNANMEKPEVVDDYTAYMAPEQLSGESCYASDQYAFGLIVYEWLLGKYPSREMSPQQQSPVQSEGNELAVTAGAIRRAARSRKRDASSQISAKIEEVIMKAIAREPEQRFSSVKDFSVALQAAIQQDPQYAPLDSRIGQIIGTYELTQLLGKGGFAKVYLGVHKAQQTQVAIKILNETFSSEVRREAFFQETRTIDRLRHPHIVRMIDYGIYHEQGNNEDLFYMVLVFAPNGTIRQRYYRTPVPITQVISYVQQVGEALQYAHDQGILHLDIKPDNMLLDVRNDVLLTDFGIASLLYNPPPNITVSGWIKGTIAYMSPEQLAGNAPSKATDQYALGTVVYEWLTGVLPFNGTDAQVMVKKINEPVPSFQQANPNISISSRVENVIKKTLAKVPGERFPEIRDFVEALKTAAALVFCSLGHENFIERAFCDECGEPLARPNRSIPEAEVW